MSVRLSVGDRLQMKTRGFVSDSTDLNTAGKKKKKKNYLASTGFAVVSGHKTNEFVKKQKLKKYTNNFPSFLVFK